MHVQPCVCVPVSIHRMFSHVSTHIHWWPDNIGLSTTTIHSCAFDERKLLASVSSTCSSSGARFAERTSTSCPSGASLSRGVVVGFVACCSRFPGLVEVSSTADLLSWLASLREDANDRGGSFPVCASVSVQFAGVISSVIKRTKSLKEGRSLGVTSQQLDITANLKRTN